MLSWIFIVFVVPLVLFLIIYLYYWKQFNYWSKLEIPHTKPKFPLGDLNGANTKRSIGESVTKIYQKHRDKHYIGFWVLFQPKLLIINPDIIKDILVRDFMSFHDRGANINEKIEPLTAHLFAIGGSKWRKLRSKMSPTFTTGKIKTMFSILTECCQLLKFTVDAQASQNNVVDVKELCACFTTDVISLYAFGVQANSLTNSSSEFRNYGKKFLEPTFINSFRVLCALLLPSVHRFFNLRTMGKESSTFFMAAFRDSIAYREKNNLKRQDFLDLLIQLMKKGSLDDAPVSAKSAPITLEEAAAQAFVFFFAGFETSATTIQFALYELAKNVDLQEKCRKEINLMLEETNGEITYDVAVQQDLITRVINETLRKYPPLPFLQRKCNEDYYIPNTKVLIPKGTIVIIDLLGMHNDNKHFPDPDIFDPDRFLEEKRSKRHNFVYLPFGEGPRNCIGTRFALMQTKVGLITLLKNYEFSIVKETPTPLTLDEKSFILAPKTGMFLGVTPISS